MKKYIQPWILVSLVALVLLASVLFFLYTSFASDKAIFDARGQKNVRVVLTDEGFIPKSIRIQRGTTITFTTTRKNELWPASNPHPSHFLYSGFDSKTPVQEGDSWSYTFELVGVWEYHDHIRSYFTGIIYVEP